MDMPSGASNPWTPTGPPTNHGFYLLGDAGAFTLSHIPMFMPPHDEQVFLDVGFVEPEKVQAAVQAAKASGTKLFTLKSTEIILPDLATVDPMRKPLRQFTGRLYAGDFLSSGVPLIERVTVTVNRVFLFQSFQAKPEPLKYLTYYCFQSQGQVCLAHVITQPPDFDHIVTAKVSGISADQIAQKAIKITFRDRANSADARLKEKESLTGATESGQVRVEVGTGLILNTTSMTSAMPPMASPVERGKPVDTVPIEFQWHVGTWKDLFDKHVDFIQLEIKRALADNRLVVYLSCPISSRGGSLSITNVEIATFTAQRLAAEWGPRFWVLNPSQYQMESQVGLGLIRMHAHELELEKSMQQGKEVKIDVTQLMDDQPPIGGDYMRMWTRVLVEDDGRIKNLGDRFAAYYFLSPSDVKAFFQQGGARNVTVGVESYFARKFATDVLFRAYFSLPLVDEQGALIPEDPQKQQLDVENRRRDFFRYYAVKASAYFSKGSHDEWNIWQKLNALRVANPDLGMGSQIAGYFEGLQVDPGAAETPISPGYQSPLAATVVPPTTKSTPAVHILAQHGVPRS
jgi:hypothetical protein